MEVIWDTRGAPQIEWCFFEAYIGRRVLENSGGPLYLVGSWDDWKSFSKLVQMAAWAPVCSARIEMDRAGFVEFQIVEDRDWGRRYYPSRDGKGICGPSARHGSNWRIHLPRRCRWLQLIFDPRGDRHLSWTFWGRRCEALGRGAPGDPSPVSGTAA